MVRHTHICKIFKVSDHFGTLWINSLNFIWNRSYKKIVRKCFKYIGYINVLYRVYKNVIKRLMYFSPPKKCFKKDVLSHNIAWDSATLNELVTEFEAKANIFNKYFASQCNAINNHSELPSTLNHFTGGKLSSFNISSEVIF